MKTVLIDYGAGNLHSVHKALEAAGLATTRTSEPEVAQSADVLVLPGQGHFGQVMKAFLASGFEPVVRGHLSRKKPFLGICVGLQLLLEASEEAPGVGGLGVIDGIVRRFDDADVSVPHMGWNRVYPSGRPDLLKDIQDGAYFYFANSYYADLRDDVPGGTTRYGRTAFKSVVAQGPLCATQFHPEKSQSAGLALLANFKRIAMRLTL